MFTAKAVGSVARVSAIAIFASLLVAGGCSADNPADFLKSIAGEWVGVCEQSTNGDRASDKYFHVKITESTPGMFETHFEYFRLNKDEITFSKVGEAEMITTIKQDGTAECKITGKGTVLVNNQPKNQEHELNELLTIKEPGGLQGHGSGKISVFGMPLGLGKNGKVQSSDSAWNIKDNILTISQNITISFRALLFTRKYDLEAKYTARRGSDVASILTAPIQVTAKPEDKI